MTASRGPEITTRTFTCAACEKTKEVQFKHGRALADVSVWTTHGFNNGTGRIDKVVTIYSCSNACSRRVGTMPPTPIVKEALEWLALSDNG